MKVILKNKGMRATEWSKREAYDLGYQLFWSGAARTREAFRRYDTSSLIPAEAWAFVRGWTQAQDDYRNGKFI